MRSMRSSFSREFISILSRKNSLLRELRVKRKKVNEKIVWLWVGFFDYVSAARFIAKKKREIRQSLSKLRLSWWKLHPHDDEDCKLEECCRVVRTCALQSQFRPFWNTSLSSPWSSVPYQWTCHSRFLSSFCSYERKVSKLSQTCRQTDRKIQNSQILIVSYQLTQLRLCHELILICTLICTRKQNHSEKHKAKDGEFHLHWFYLFLFDYHKLSQLHDDS